MLAMNDPIPQEALAPLSKLITVLGVGLAVWGVCNTMGGYGNDDPALQKLGERQVKAGGNLVVLAVYAQKGTLPPPEIMKYLSA